jgi:FtsP/CotA-like multicopper oxidase with cupredoxin domain
MLNNDNKTISRRSFIKVAGLAGIGLTACRNNSADVEAIPVAAVDTTTQHDELDMDKAHEDGINVFLANIGTDPIFWGNKLDYEMDGDTKVFRITCQQTEWEVEPGKVINAFTYNGTVPGPEIRVVEGDNIRILVTNEMEQSTSIHWHGLRVPNNMDGVPFLNQPLIKTGETFTYEFEARNAGSHMYHSHHNALEQVTKGLLGPIIVEPKDKSQDPEFDSDYTIIMNDSGIGFSLNGKSFPYTQPIVAKLGEKVRVRYMNEGLMIHPMHLHGLEQLVFAKDGWNLPQPYYCDTVNVAPGERYDVIVDCHSPGVWAFHCHILSHAESAHGMFGMVTVMIVE